MSVHSQSQLEDPVEVESVEIAPEDEPEPTNILKESIAQDGLSVIAPTANNLSYAFTRMDLEEAKIDDLGVALRCYQHLRHFNMSKNDLRNFDELIHLPYLQTVNVS